MSVRLEDRVRVNICFSQDLKGLSMLVALHPSPCPLPLSPTCMAAGKTLIPSSLLAPSACTPALLGPQGFCHLPCAPPLYSRRTTPAWVTYPGSFVLDDLRRYSVDLRYAVFQTQGSVPTSTVIVSEANGSRTILHAYRFVHLSVSYQLPPPPPLLPASLNSTIGLSF